MNGARENKRQHHEWPPCLNNPSSKQQKGSHKPKWPTALEQGMCFSSVSLFCSLTSEWALHHRAHILPFHFHTPKFLLFSSSFPLSPPFFSDLFILQWMRSWDKSYSTFSLQTPLFLLHKCPSCLKGFSVDDNVIWYQLKFLHAESVHQQEKLDLETLRKIDSTT